MDKKYCNNKLVEVIWRESDELFLDSKDAHDKFIRVAAYCRTSSEKDKHINSLNNQIQYFTKYIEEKKDYKLIGIYTDRAISGRNKKKRPGFLRLLRHCEEEKIDLILTKSISRFSRNSQDLLETIRRLKELNIGVIFEEEKISTLSITNEFLITTLAGVAEEEARNLSEMFKLAYKQRFMKGIPKFFRILGYQVNYIDGKPQIYIIEEEAIIVRKIFDLYMKGISMSEIARQMMKKGYETQKGKDKWAWFNIKCILTNYRYTGNIKSKIFKENEYFNDPVNNAKDYQYIIENYHDSIINQELFDLVQKKIDKNRKNGYAELKYQTNHLSGRVFCGTCGSKWYKKSNKSFQCKLSLIDKHLCNRAPVSEINVIDMMKKAFTIRYDFLDSQVLKKLQRDIEKTNFNDHFEYHRMSFGNKLEAAREIEKLALEKDCEYEAAKLNRQEIEENFREKEEVWEQIENDRKYRDMAIEWMKHINDKEVFLQQITIEYMRAWIREITIFTCDSCVIHWMDNMELKIGDCIALQEHKTEYLRSQKEIKKEDLTLKFTNTVDTKKSESNPAVLKIYNREYLKESLNWQLMNSKENIQKLVSTKNKVKTRVCAYCRVSTDHDDQKSSYSFQIAYYTYLIMKNPDWSFCGIYADEGISATQANNRTQFQKMISDASAGKFDRIIIKSISRFSRNTVDCLKYVRLCKSMGVSIFFERENIDTLDKKSEVLLTVYSSLGQEESRNLSENVKWGNLKKIERGIVSQPGKKYYGFDTDEENRWKINEDQAAVVRRIYSDYLLKDKSVGTIAKELTEEKIANQYGNTLWYRDRVTGMLESEKYAGHMMLYKYFSEDVLAKTRKNDKGYHAKYFIENHHEAIINQKMWDEVQLKRKQRAEKYNFNTGKKYEYTDFSKKLYCAKCGTVLGHITKTSTLKNNEIKARHLWRCRVAIGRTFASKCDTPSIREESIKHTFMSMLLEMRKTDYLKQEVQKAISIIKLNENELTLLDETKKKMEGLYQELYRTVKSHRGIDMSSVSNLTDKIMKLQKCIDELNEREERSQVIQKEFDWFVGVIKTVEDFDPEQERIEFREDIFNRIVEKGIVFRDGRIIYDLVFGIQWTTHGNQRQNWRLKMKVIEKLVLK